MFIAEYAAACARVYHAEPDAEREDSNTAGMRIADRAALRAGRLRQGLLDDGRATTDEDALRRSESGKRRVRDAAGALSRTVLAADRHNHRGASILGRHAERQRFQE